jgi:hypothetical protein
VPGPINLVSDDEKRGLNQRCGNWPSVLRSCRWS